MQPPSPDDQPTIRTGPPNGSRPASQSGMWQAPSVEEMQALLPQYEIMEILGRGGMGAVYKGRQKSLKRLVAIKILPLGMADDEMKFAERFQNEAQTMAAMNHPAIVSVYDFGETPDGLLYFIMEFVDGTDVHKMIQASGRLSDEYALAITAHVCDALSYAHKRGVIHRDIKPANILIDQEGHIKVADFGLAKMNDPAQTSGLTKTNMAMGTPDYVAPEVLVTGMVADHRADIYAVGVMLYQMLTGEVPRGMFKLPSQKGIGSDPRFDEIICKAMEQDRDERYQSATDVRRDLDVILTAPQPKDDGTGVVPVKEIPQKPVAKQPRPPGEKSQPPAQKPAPQQAPAQKAAAAPKAKAPPKKQSPAIMWLSIGGIVAVLGVAGFLILGGKPKPLANATTDTASATAPSAKPQPPIKVSENPKPTAPGTSASAQGKEIDLLPLVDVKRDMIGGEWSRDGGDLVVKATKPDANGTPRLQLPFQPPEEYDFEIEFTPESGTNMAGQALSAYQHSFSWFMDGKTNAGSKAGFDAIDGIGVASRTDGTTMRAKFLTNGQRHRSTIEVRRNGVRALLDGEPLVTWGSSPKSYERLEISKNEKMRDALHLGLIAYDRAVRFHKITVREITGTGKVDADGSPSTQQKFTADIVTWVDQLNTAAWSKRWSFKDGVLTPVTVGSYQEFDEAGDTALRVKVRQAPGPSPTPASTPSLQPALRYGPVNGKPQRQASYQFQAYMPGRSCALVYLEEDSGTRANPAPAEYLLKGLMLPKDLIGKPEIEWEFRAIGDELTIWADGQLVGSARDSRLSFGRTRLTAYPGVEIVAVQTPQITSAPPAASASAGNAPPQISNWQDMTGEARATAKATTGFIVDTQDIRLDPKIERMRLMLTPSGPADQAVRVRYSGEVQVDLRINSSSFLYVQAQIHQTIFQGQPTGTKVPVKLAPTKLHPADFDTGRPHELLLTIEGTRLRAWLDGRFVSEATTDTQTGGGTALMIKPTTVLHQVEVADLKADPAIAPAITNGKVDAPQEAASPVIYPPGTEKIDWLKSAKWDAPWSIANGRLKSTDKDKTRYLGVAREATVRLRFRDDDSEAVSKTSPPLQVTFYGHAKGGSQANEGTYQLQVFPARHRLLLAKINKDAVKKADVPTSIWKDVAFPAAPPGEEDMELQLRSVGDEISVWSGAERLASAHDDRGRAGGWLLIGSPGVEITTLETIGITPNPGTISPPEAGNAPPQIANWQDVTATLLEKARGIQGAIIQDGAVHLAKGSAPQHVLLTPPGMSHFAMRVRYTGGTQVDRVKEGYGFHFVICQKSQVGFKRVTKGAVSEDLCPWASPPAGYDSNAPHDLLVTMNGAQVRAWVDGFFMGEARDEVITEGEGWLMLKDYTIIHKVEVAELGAASGQATPEWTDWLGPKLATGTFGPPVWKVEKDGLTSEKPLSGRNILPGEIRDASVRVTYDLRDSSGIQVSMRERNGKPEGRELYVADDTGVSLYIARMLPDGTIKSLVSHNYPSQTLRTATRTLEFRCLGETLTATVTGATAEPFIVTATDTALQSGPASVSLKKGVLLKKVETLLDGTR